MLLWNKKYLLIANEDGDFIEGETIQNTVCLYNKKIKWCVAGKIRATYILQALGYNTKIFRPYV